jgi:hypothetical protein
VNDVSVFVHLKPPIGHGKLLPVNGVIAGKLTRLAVRVRDAFGTHTLKNADGWPHFGDHQLALFRRSPTGPISAINHWLDFGDHPVASFRRSRSGSIAPIINSFHQF